ncbi:MAG TPA: DUF2270 domain-containing protein [Steroidobacteraceae bacterium]|jgi:uncharacterized membrane protein
MADLPESNSAEPVGVPQPGTTTEAITALAHYYRGEITRMISWRDRLDRTTNWAIGALAAMLSISLATEQAHHSVLLFAMLLILSLLVIEARRYRFFHVYRARVRLIEREYFAVMFATRATSVRVDLGALSEGLRAPRFTVSLMQAMSRRLRRNYGWIFLVVLLAWLVKTTSMNSGGHARLIHTLSEFLTNTAIAGIPGGVVVLGIAALYAWLGFVMLRFGLDEDELGPGQVHV